MATAAPRQPVSLFGKTLVVSLLFHLSAITLFSIVIYFPKQDLHFYRLAFVEEPATTLLAEELPTLEDRLTRPRPVPSADAFTLPEFTFRLRDDERLQVKGQSLFEEPTSPAPDSWAMFGQGIQQVRSSLLGMAGVRPLRLSGEAVAGAEAEVSGLALGPGLRATLDWGGAVPREVFYSPPAFFSAAPISSTEFFVTVDATGAVTRALSMAPSPSAFEAEALTFLRRCRFAPVTGGLTTTVSIRIAPAEEGSAP